MLSMPLKHFLNISNIESLSTSTGTKFSKLYQHPTTCFIFIFSSVAKNFSKNSNLDDCGISLPVFPSRTNLKLHNISITPKMVEKVIMNLNSSKASGLDCIPVVVLKNCEPELSYIPAELFNMCMKESCFPDCCKVPLVVSVFKNVGNRSTAKNYCPVSLLSVVVKSLKNL